ncbi:MAG: polyprenyl synthetase family protein [bacterium]
MLNGIIKNSQLNFLSKLDFKRLKDSYSEIITVVAGDFKKHISTGLLDKSKKIRSTLLLLFAKNNNCTNKAMYFYGAMLELIHLASLVHDDIIDNGTQRRGNQCLHRQWGIHNAILFGDYIYMYVINAILNYPGKNFNKIIASATQQLVRGEIYQSTRSGATRTSEEEYIDFISDKTGALFMAASYIGTALCTDNRKLIEAAGRIGINLGRAFQIKDDLLDIETAKKSVLGKDTYNDIQNGNITLPVIYFIKNSTSETRTEFKKLFGKRQVDYSRLYGLLEQSGSLEYSQVKAASYIEKAKRDLCIFPDNVYKKHIYSLLDFIIERKK